MPPLDIYIANKTFERLFQPKTKELVKYSRSPLNLHVGLVDRTEFTKMMAEAAFFMCPSVLEGYGHYLNQARAAGAVTITTDLSPMNELIVSNETGFLIPVQRLKHPMELLGGNYKGSHGLKGVEGLVASFQDQVICEVVKRIMQTTTAVSCYRC